MNDKIKNSLVDLKAVNSSHEKVTTIAQKYGLGSSKIFEDMKRLVGDFLVEGIKDVLSEIEITSDKTFEEIKEEIAKYESWRKGE